MNYATYLPIFKPSFRNVFLAIVLTVILHVYIVESTIRQAALGNTSEISDFWLANLILALPYLETDNTFLKFVTFFIGSYILVWIGAFVFRVLDNLQVRTVKQLRKK